MINRFVGAATLFTAGAIFLVGAPQLSASPLATTGTGSALTQAGSCGAQDMKKDEAPKDKQDPKAPAKAEKGKDGSCGKGSCGSKDRKKGKKDGTCGKDKKEATCGKDKK